MAVKEAIHLEPLWRDRADFIIGADVSDPQSGEARHEQLWARRVSANEFEICCIPFFTYGLALGDVVQTTSTNYVITRVAKRSGHSTFRVWLGNSPNPTRVREEVMDKVNRMGCAYEQSSENLLAIDAPPGSGRALWDALKRLEGEGLLQVESGREDAVPP